MEYRPWFSQGSVPYLPVPHSWLLGQAPCSRLPRLPHDLEGCWCRPGLLGESPHLVPSHLNSERRNSSIPIPLSPAHHTVVFVPLAIFPLHAVLSPFSRDWGLPPKSSQVSRASLRDTSAPSHLNSCPDPSLHSSVTPVLCRIMQPPQEPGTVIYSPI